MKGTKINQMNACENIKKENVNENMMDISCDENIKINHNNVRY